MCSLRFENNFLTIEGVRFASISKKTPLSKLSFAFVSLALPLLSLSIPCVHQNLNETNKTEGRSKEVATQLSILSKGQFSINISLRTTIASIL